MSDKNKLTNRSCGLDMHGMQSVRERFAKEMCFQVATKKRGHHLIGVADYSRRQAESPTGERRPMAIEVETILPVTRA